MMLTTILLSAALASPIPAPGVTDVEFSAPAARVDGEPFVVELTFVSDGPVELWRFTPSAFEAGGKPLGERGADTVDMPQGSRVKVSFDLGTDLPAGDFQLGCAGAEAKVDVTTYKPVPRGELSYMDMTAEELAKYRALLVTNRGTILLEMWPDVAPNHVRNFLDLIDSGFYEGILFHRVSPSFMIQGGDPNTRDFPDDRRQWGSGGGPRMVPAEFNDRKHVPGVLSAARTNDPNSHSSQFFLMTAANTGLDGQYSAFGKVLDGMETVMRIARAKGTPYSSATMPDEPQRIERAYVLPPQ